MVWEMWIIVAVLLFIAEIFLPTFLPSCIAIGCLIGGIFAYFHFGVKIQLITFSFGTLASFFGIRPFMLKYAHRKNGMVKTNTDALIGKVGRVTISIDNSKGQGRLTVEGDDWKAETENNEIINAGENVLITNVNSTILIVKQIN